LTATASFGSPIKWSTGAVQDIPKGHSMTMADAITTVSEKIIWLLLAPKVGHCGVREVWALYTDRREMNSPSSNFR
jgi:hypothetical protein